MALVAPAAWVLPVTPNMPIKESSNSEWGGFIDYGSLGRKTDEKVQ